MGAGVEANQCTCNDIRTSDLDCLQSLSYHFLLCLLHALCRLLQFLHFLYCRRCRPEENPAVHLTLLLPPLNGRRFNLSRQCLHPIRCHQQCVLKLRRSLSIGRRGRPIVRPRKALGRPLTNHGFDRKGMSRRHPSIGFGIAVMKDVGIGMKDRTNSMSAEFLHRGKAPGGDVILNDGPNVLVIVVRLDELHRLDPAIVRGLDEIPSGLVGFARHEHFRAISVISVQVARNVDVDDVPLGQRTIVGDTVADD
mmetsp:Transcript_30471/g.89088  ORF Transcript_30471/g.89088 Transcript_30471/m.89088 type:complete len:252 (-) Transcript_30471:51-806(-)